MLDYLAQCESDAIADGYAGFEPALIHDLLVTHPLVASVDLVCPHPY